MNRSLVTVLAASAAIFVSSSVQAAPLITGSSIDLAGYVQAVGSATLNNATGLDFVTGPGGAASPGVAGTVATYGSGTGSFTGFNCNGGTCGTILDISNLVLGAQ